MVRIFSVDRRSTNIYHDLAYNLPIGASMKGMNGMKSAGVCGLWIMVGQCLVSTAPGS